MTRITIATAGVVALCVGLLPSTAQAVAPPAAPAKAQQPARIAPPAATPRPRPAHAATKLNVPAPAGMTVEAQTAFVKQYCVGCHNDRGKERAGSLSLAAFDAAAAVDNAALTEK